MTENRPSELLLHRDRSPRPLLLDAFCGAGGCSVGFHRAGFDVVGIDLKEQPNYPYPFIQGDALEVLALLIAGEGVEASDGRTYYLRDFAAIHASPPCQAHSTIGKQIRQRFGHIEHVDLVEPTRALLRKAGLPYVIENVPGAPLVNALQLCGSSFGLNVRRHRLFECSFAWMAQPCAHYWQTPRFRSLDQRRKGEALASVVGVHGHLNYAGEKEIREVAMGIDWMTPAELAQAIPPAYTEHIGGYLMNSLTLEAAA